MRKIYLDNAATTAMDEKVAQAMKPYFSEKYGNASSSHYMGREAHNAIESARGVIAKSIGASAGEIIFTSGGTEANNLAIKGFAFANRARGNHLITTKIEHPSVLNVFKWLETQGFETTYIDVDKEGFASAEDLEKAIGKKTILFSVVHGNNEIGTIQNLQELGRVCRERNVCFHTDACQSYTKTLLDVKKQNLDMVTLNAHKIHGPKGVGALYIKDGMDVTPWMHGGGHERNLRSGTENVPGIVGFAEAVKIGMDKKHVEYATTLRDRLIENLLAVEESRLNGPNGAKRLCNNVNLTFRGVEGEAMGGYLEAEGICSSTGSACSSHSLKASHVLTAIGLTKEEANSSIRLTLSRLNTMDEIDYVSVLLPKIVKKLRSMSSRWGMVKNVFKKNN